MNEKPVQQTSQESRPVFKAGQRVYLMCSYITAALEKQGKASTQFDFGRVILPAGLVFKFLGNNNDDRNFRFDGPNSLVRDERQGKNWRIPTRFLEAVPEEVPVTKGA